MWRCALRVIGLCGGSGSGKGTVAKIFERYQVQSIDTDAVYHKITLMSWRDSSAEI